MRARWRALVPVTVSAVVLMAPGCAPKKQVKLEMTREVVLIPPEIRGISIDPSGRLDTRTAGHTVEVTMTGADKLEATFDIDGRFQARPMQEVEPGVYVGSFDVRKGETGAVTVTGHLLHPPSGALNLSKLETGLQLFESAPPPPEHPVRDDATECAKLDAVLHAATVHFEFDAHDLTTGAKGTLSGHREALASHASCRIEIHGHTDEVGTDRYNVHLSSLRALEVAKFLRSLGLGGERFAEVPHGKTQPVDTGSSSEAHARNRRVELHALAPN